MNVPENALPIQYTQNFVLKYDHLPIQHSLHILRSTFGMSVHERYWSCDSTIENTSLDTRVMESPLSHRTRDKLNWFSCTNWSGLNTIGFSYQNLKYISFQLSIVSINLFFFFFLFFSVFTFFIQFITKQYIYIYVIYSKHRSMSLTSVQ